MMKCSTKVTLGSPVPHSGIPEALNEGNKWSKLFNLTLNLLSHSETAWDGLEVFHTLVHGLEGTVDVGSE